MFFGPMRDQGLVEGFMTYHMQVSKKRKSDLFKGNDECYAETDMQPS